MSELYPHSKQVPMMKYGKAPADEKLSAVLNSGKYLAQIKKDGFGYMLEKTDEGELYFFSRSVSRKTGELTEKIDHVPHIQEWGNNLPNGTTIIGEIYYPNGTSKNVTSIMGALADKAISRQINEFGFLHYYIFDVIRYAGQDLINESFGKRYQYIEKIANEMPREDWLEYGWAKETDLENFIQEALLRGEEGCVIKSKSKPYAPDKRPVYNFKVKQKVDNLDFVIMDVLPPEKLYTGKELNSWDYWIVENGKRIPVTKAYYNGWAGAISVGAYDRYGKLQYVGRVASGLTDDLKQDLAIYPKSYILSVCEVQVMSLDNERHTFRHPFLVRLRPDKDAHDCKMDEIFS